jgi:hypothetical protein
MSNLPNSPLFSNASREIQHAARRAFDESDLGRLASQARRLIGSRADQARTRQQMGDLLRDHRNFTPERAVRQLMGADFGTIVHEIQRYAQRGIGSRLLGQFLESLGPAGSMIRALVGGLTGGRARGQALARQLSTAADMLRAFGFEILPPGGRRGVSLGDVNRSTSAAREYLESLGYQVTTPEDLAEARRHGVSALPGPTGGEYHVDLPFGTTTRRFLASHPIATGEMVRAAGSSNVWAFGYLFNEGALYVRFANKSSDGHPTGPGPLYRYQGVTPDQFLSMLNAGSKGSWVWDNLRIRGTISGHQKDYDLVGIMPTAEYPEGYIPRKATVEPVMEYYGVRGQPLVRPRKIGNREIFVQREVQTTRGNWLRSQLTSTRGPIGPTGPGGPGSPRGGR